MKALLKSLTFLSIVTFLFQGCSSHKVIYESETHLYDNNFGVSQPYHEPDEAQMILEQNNAVYTAHRNSFNTDPALTTELRHDPEAFLLEEYIEPEPVVTYKYMHSSKFFREDELPANKLLTTQELERY